MKTLRVFLTSWFLLGLSWCGICCLETPCHAASEPVLDGGEVTFTHNGGFGGAPTSKETILLDFAETANPAIQFSNISLGGGGNTSTAEGGAGYFDNPRVAAITFGAGTGISQSAPDGDNPPAELKLSLDVLFETTAPNAFENGIDPWGPLVVSYSFPLEGFVSDGGFVEFTIDVQIFGGTCCPDSIGEPWERTISDRYFNDTPGAFNTVVSSSMLVPAVPGITPGFAETHLVTIGEVIFRAKGDGGPSEIDMASAGGFQATVVPEPSTLALAVLGLIGMGWRRRK